MASRKINKDTDTHHTSYKYLKIKTDPYKSFSQTISVWESIYIKVYKKIYSACKIKPALFVFK